ncbi:DNA-directed RNA polymerase subunit delta [Weizmannia sp. FSL W8-0401]|uniref:DNA-directed RNA polymerase subunit delta n=1 Tax=Weizmannia sp. FSL W8-0401 TaxID=2954554 RepID=UPI00037CB480|nr:DNA-directed RNA polymerase subunit delta [Heyndrickxia coagulans]
MSLRQLPKEELKEMSFIELAEQILEEKKQVTSFQDLLAEIGAILGLPKEETESKMIQFYTDLNIDGRFISLGDNTWGLRAWYPVDQIDEEVTHTVKTKRKKAKVVEEEEDFIDDEDLDLEDIDDVAEDEEEDFADEDEEDEDLVDDEFSDIDEDEEETFEDEELLTDDFDVTEDEDEEDVNDKED